MEKKKVIFLNNHFKYSDGTVKALIGLVNELDKKKYDITIKPIYKCDKRLEKDLDSQIHLEKGFGFYFRGFDKIIKLLPKKFLYKKFINKKYDIEIAFQCGIPTMIVGNSKNKFATKVIWMHGYKVYKELFERADQVLCVSKYNSELCKKEVCNGCNVDFCYNLVDESIVINFARDEIDYKPKVQGPVFVSVGRHSPEKGYPRLIKILAELRNEGLKCNLVLVGDGPQHQEIEEIIKSLKMNNEVTLVGAQNNPHKYTSKADVFICSSYSEGYSTACTEAAILGVPIVTTNVPGGEEIIDDCGCGMLTSIDDEGLKQSLRELLMNQNLINEWKRTMVYSKTKFYKKNRVKKLEDYFEEFSYINEQRITNDK